MKKIKILKILSTIFLIGFVYTRVISPTDGGIEIEVLKLDFKMFLSTSSDTMYLSSLLVGFLLSLYANFLSMKLARKKVLFIISFMLALFGTISYLNEFFRLFFNHIQIIMSFPILLVILDWIGYFSVKKYVSVEN